MARKKAAEPEPSFDELRETGDACWMATMERERRGTDSDNLQPAGQARFLTVGLPLPSLALEILFQSNVIPLGRFYVIKGEPSSCKSTFLAEVFRWVLLHYGYGVINENENKDTAELRESLWDYNPDWLGDPLLPVEERVGRCRMQYPVSMNEWQENITGLVDQLTIANEGRLRKIEDDEIKRSRRKGPAAEESAPKEANGAAPRGHGWRWPFAIGVDSLAGTGSSERLTKIHKEGSASRDFGDALILSKYMHALPGLLRKTSILLAATNHAKPSLDLSNPFAPPKSNSPGGRAPRFMETVEIEMERGAKLRTVDHSGLTLHIGTTKNSLGEGDKVIDVPLIWEWRLDESGTVRQHSYFDWPTATTWALVALERSAVGVFRSIRDNVLDLHPVKGQRIWSKRLGVAEESPVTYHELGRMIDEDMALRRELYPYLHVTTRPVFVPGRPLAETIRRAEEDLATEIQTENRYVVRNLTDFADVVDNLSQESGYGTGTRKRAR